MALVIKCNNIPRQMIYGADLPDKVKKDFDYLSDEDLNVSDFFKYKGQYYYLGEISSAGSDGNPLNAKGFDGYTVDSAFSGLVVKLTNDPDYIIVGQWLDL